MGRNGVLRHHGAVPGAVRDAAPPDISIPRYPAGPGHPRPVMPGPARD